MWVCIPISSLRKFWRVPTTHAVNDALFKQACIMKTTVYLGKCEFNCGKHGPLFNISVLKIISFFFSTNGHFIINNGGLHLHFKWNSNDKISHKMLTPLDLVFKVGISSEEIYLEADELRLKYCNSDSFSPLFPWHVMNNQQSELNPVSIINIYFCGEYIALKLTWCLQNNYCKVQCDR